MKNHAASIRARLLNLAKKENIDFQLIIIRYLHERLLYRLSVSDHLNQFILKGGSFIYAVQGIKTRPTIDVDFLGQQIANDIETICETFRSICKIETDDEVQFQPESIVGEIITRQDKYSGVRLFVEAEFDTIRQRLQIDAGFGDIIIPKSQTLMYPVLLEDMHVPLILAYSIETVIAEKFQAMIEFSFLNSRMKDFYDVYLLLLSGDIDPDTLQEAINATFHNRETFYSDNHIIFTEEFSKDSQRQRNWKAFLRKINYDLDLKFEAVMHLLTDKLFPCWEKIKRSL